MKAVIYNKIFLKIGLYILSLFWFFLLLIICEFKPCLPIEVFLTKNIVSIIALVGLAFSVMFMLIFNHISKGAIGEVVQIKEIEDVTSDQLTFLVTYILPLIFYEYNNLRSIFNIIIIMFVIGVIFCKTNLFYSNPTLALFRYKAYKVKIGNCDDNIYLLYKYGNALHKGDRIYVNKLNDNTFFAHKSNLNYR